MAKGQSLTDWIQKGDPEVCRPCLLAPVAAWYADALMKGGRQKEAQELQRELDVLNLTPEIAASALDGVRQKACSDGDAQMCERLSELNETLFINAEALG